jgi:hypothetical protein
MIRTATHDDLPAVRELWRAFETEIPDAPHRDSDAEEDLAQLEAAVNGGIVVLAEEDGAGPVGLAVARRTGDRVAFLDLLYVRPEARTSGKDRESIRLKSSHLHVARMATSAWKMLTKNTDERTF